MVVMVKNSNNRWEVWVVRADRNRTGLNFDVKHSTIVVKYRGQPHGVDRVWQYTIEPK